MTCRDCNDLMARALYDELSADERAGFEAHTASCERCSSLFREMQKTLRIMDFHVRVEPDEASTGQYWESIRSKVGPDLPLPAISGDKKFHRRAAHVPAWAYGIAAVLLVAFGIYLGRTYFTSRQVRFIARLSSAVTEEVLGKVAALVK